MTIADYWHAHPIYSFIALCFLCGSYVIGRLFGGGGGNGK